MMRALRDEVILKPDDVDEQTTASGIVVVAVEDSIPAAIDGNPIPSTVVSVGPDADPDLEVGQRVWCRTRHRRAAVFEHGGGTYSRVPSHEIDAIIES
jgi:co-chaperonin GroES (HSP10)